MSNRSEKEIWVFGDLRNERFFGFGLNVLAKAREVAQSVPAKVVMVLIGLSDVAESEINAVAHACIPPAAAEQRCLDHGADKVWVLNITGLSVPRADIYGYILSEAVLKHKPLLVLFALTDFGWLRELPDSEMPDYWRNAWI